MTSLVLLALVPVIILTALGAILRQRQFIADDFWPQAERLSYFVLLPCLFVQGLATAQIAELPIGNLVLTLVLATLAVAALVVALRPVMKLDGPAFTSVFQGSVRFNNYVGVTLAAGLLGAKGVALAAICNAAVVPLVNVLCVIVFARYGIAKLNGWAIFRQILTNPLIGASFGGLIFQLLDLALPSGVDAAMRYLGAASLPLGLLCVGAAVRATPVKQWIGPIVSSSALKFLAMPIATILFGIIFGLSGPAMIAALIFRALPTASSAYIMARQLGGDAPLMAAITAAQTVLALVAIPLVLSGLFTIIELSSAADR